MTVGTTTPEGTVEPGDQDTTVDRATAHRRALKARRTQAMTRLLAERGELRGISPMADLVHESVFWSA